MLQIISSSRNRGASPIIEGVTLEAIVAHETLIEAWTRVRRNKGGPGGDGVTIEMFGQDLEAQITTLGHQALTQTYRPRKVRRTSIPKRSGGMRKLMIPAVTDRVLQTAAMLVISESLDGKLSNSSWAYREGRGVENAVSELQDARAGGFIWTLDADIAHYFDRVPHRRLIEEMMIWIDDVRVIRLLRTWLRSFNRWGRGIAQGSPISPLLANLFLHPLDRLLELEGFRLVRYADDFVVLCEDAKPAAMARKITASHLNSRGLSLKAAKTRIIGPDEPFIFLGRLIEGVREARRP